MCLFVSGIFFLILLDEELALELGIVQFCVGIEHLAAKDKTLKPFNKLFLAKFWITMELAEGCRLNRMVNDVVRLDQMLFRKFFKKFCNKNTTRSRVDFF